MYKDIVTSKITPLTLFICITAVTLISVFGIYFQGISFGLLMLVVPVGIPAIGAIVIYPKFGILVLLIAAYLIMWVIRFGVNFPLGTLMDGLQLLLIVGFFIRQKRNMDYTIFRNPLTIVLILWILYNLLQVLNPEAASQLAWLYTIRSIAGVALLYFVFSTQIRSIKFIRLIFKVWIALAFFAALYAFKQEYVGFFPFEFNDINNPLQRSLLFIGGRWRKFSIFSDPVAFSYNMVTCSILCIVLILNQVKIYKKVILGLLVLFFMTAMIFSGTRGANVLLPAAIVLFAVMKFNFKVLMFSAASGLFLLFLIFLPTGNQNIQRFQSAFRPSNDASFNLRKINQKRIQPYIQQHPFGGGLGATGTWGSRFAPDSFLAKFPPDSGYVRVAVEVGWVGLLLFCTFMFTTLATGINNYYKINNPELKNYCLAMVLIVFALGIANYPQEALVQFPTSVYFYLFIALINILPVIDKRIHRNEI